MLRVSGRMASLILILATVLVLFLSLGVSALTASEKARLQQDLLDDTRQLMGYRQELQKAMLEYKEGSKSEAELLELAQDLFSESVDLFRKTGERASQLWDKVTPYDSEGVRLTYGASALWYSVSSLNKAASVAMKRFSDDALTEGEKAALEELVSVYLEMSNIYSEIKTIYTTRF